MPHPHLWPAILGAALGLVVLARACAAIVRDWPRLAARGRVRRVAALGAFALFYAVSVDAWLVEPRLLVVRRAAIETPRWHGAPLTVAAIGDIHVGGPHVDEARVVRLVERVNALRPDLVVLLGDFIAGHDALHARSPREQDELLAGMRALGALRAPLGVIAVLGNHDAWYDHATVARALTEAGITTLTNGHALRREGAHTVVLAGLADEDTGVPNLDEALAGAPRDADTIVLAHSPDSFARLAAGPALMLGAHSHCGQVYVPFLGRPVLPLRHRRYACHLVEEGEKRVFVTGGFGTSILPVRFLTPPEIALVTVSAAEPQGRGDQRR